MYFIFIYYSKVKKGTPTKIKRKILKKKLFDYKKYFIIFFFFLLI
jgi:hypothetical protein